MGAALQPDRNGLLLRHRNVLRRRDLRSHRDNLEGKKRADAQQQNLGRGSLEWIFGS